MARWIFFLATFFFSGNVFAEMEGEQVFKSRLNEVQMMPDTSCYSAGTHVILRVYASGGSETGIHGRDGDLWRARCRVALDWIKKHQLVLDDTKIIYVHGYEGDRGVAISRDEEYYSRVEFQKETQEDIQGLRENDEVLDRRLNGHDDQIKKLWDKVFNKPEFSTDWSLLLGSQIVSFGVPRDLCAPISAGLEFRYKKFFVQALGGLNPWSSEGYRGYYYRDAVGSANLGFIFWQPGKFKFSLTGGGIIGWEYTTSNNQYTLQVNGINSGLGFEYKINKGVSFVSNVSFVHAEIEDITPRSGIMRNGGIVNFGIKLF